ncbi:sulfate/molybdate ABC transporter ATP-binding protein [Janibacter cremeus]|uniref:Molybdate transport system ATP-binding protein n=1 Tax=Janibacter cremeus TaxID=1285192 RepID=A0A852VR11_9MICO|nr:ABC transporter ATP-binding protein [Janibacter cremeus]NYF97870.1 molybdate transport system ATP-binding protein [Janibacter cremeus]
MSLQVRADWAQRGLAVDLDLPAGRHAVTGPNGSGKSSLLSVIAGLSRPDRARVVLDGRALDEVPPHRRRVGLMSQAPALFPHLDVRDNVAFGPRSTGRGRRGARDTANHWLEVVGMSSFADRRPAQLSGGQAARVALARALAAEPDALLLDEPLAALDVEATPAMRAVLADVTHAREDLVVVLVTHDVLDVLTVADGVADTMTVLGERVEHGPVRQVLEHPRSAFTAGLAGVNLVHAAALSGSGARTPTADGPLEIATGPHDVTGACWVTFAPDAVSLHREQPEGSPRNVWHGRVSRVEAHAGRARVWLSTPLPMSAEVTPAALAALPLRPGDRVWASVKASQVRVHPAHTDPVG